MNRHKLSPTRIKELVHRELSKWLSSNQGVELSSSSCTPEEAQKHAIAHEHMASEYRKALATYNHDIVKKDTLELLRKQNVKVPHTILNPLSITASQTEKLYTRVAREITEAKVHYFNTLSERNSGLTDYGVESTYAGLPINTNTAPVLSTLWESYTQYKTMELIYHKWTESYCSRGTYCCMSFFWLWCILQ